MLLSPTNAPLLNYSLVFNPDPLNVATAATLTLTVNLSSDDDIWLKRLAFILPIGSEASDLVNESSDLSVSWQAIPTGMNNSSIDSNGIFFIETASPVRISHQQPIVIVITAQSISNLTGNVRICATELAGRTNTNIQQAVYRFPALVKQQVAFSVNEFMADHGSVYSGEPLTLSWRAVGVATNKVNLRLAWLGHAYDPDPSQDRSVDVTAYEIVDNPGHYRYQVPLDLVTQQQDVKFTLIALYHQPATVAVRKDFPLSQIITLLPATIAQVSLSNDTVFPGEATRLSWVSYGDIEHLELVNTQNGEKTRVDGKSQFLDLKPVVSTSYALYYCLPQQPDRRLLSQSFVVSVYQYNAKAISYSAPVAQPINPINNTPPNNPVFVSNGNQLYFAPNNCYWYNHMESQAYLALYSVNSSSEIPGVMASCCMLFEDPTRPTNILIIALGINSTGTKLYCVFQYGSGLSILVTYDTTTKMQLDYMDYGFRFVCRDLILSPDDSLLYFLATDGDIYVANAHSPLQSFVNRLDLQGYKVQGNIALHENNRFYCVACRPDHNLCLLAFDTSGFSADTLNPSQVLSALPIVMSLPLNSAVPAQSLVFDQAGTKLYLAQVDTAKHISTISVIAINSPTSATYLTTLTVEQAITTLSINPASTELYYAVNSNSYAALSLTNSAPYIASPRMRVFAQEQLPSPALLTSISDGETIYVVTANAIQRNQKTITTAPGISGTRGLIANNLLTRSDGIGTAPASAEEERISPNPQLL